VGAVGVHERKHLLPSGDTEISAAPKLTFNANKFVIAPPAHGGRISPFAASHLVAQQAQ
jgi:hypothetical protein